MAVRDDEQDPNADWWTTNAPPPAATPSGPITGPSDPRLADPRYATDPEVLKWINVRYGATPATPDQPATSGTALNPPYPGAQWDPIAQAWKPKPDGTTTPVTTPGPAVTPKPIGVPTSGFGSAAPDYTSDPNAPQYTPLPTYTPPTWTGGDFVNPTEAELLASPGYQARLDSLIKGRERASAAQGTILSGGTLKALDRAGQDYASNEYQQFRGNALENYRQRYSQFQDAAGMDFNARTLNANNNQANWQNQTTRYNTGNARTLSDYLTNVTKTRNAELDYWGRLNDLNQTGSGLAGNSYRP